VTASSIPLSAATVLQAVEGGYDAFSASALDLINLGTTSLAGQSNVGGSLYSSYANGTGLNNGTVYADGDRDDTEYARTYCPANGSSITFDLNLAAQPAGYTIGSIASISGGSQNRRSQRFRLEYSTVGSSGFTTIVDENQLHFVSNASAGEMRVMVRDDTGVPLASNVDQVRVTYFDTSAPLPQSMYRELDVFAPASNRNPLPAVTSASLKARFDAGDVDANGGVASPASGSEINTWRNTVTAQPLNHNYPTDGKAAYIGPGDGGINDQPTVRWEATASGGDLMFNNSMSFQAQTIIAVATMKDNGASLATMMCNKNASLNIRQATTASAAYFSGNSADFIYNNGTFTINGNPRWDIPGGFDAPHVLKAVRNAPVTFDGFRISDNIRPERRWNGDIAEILIFDSKLSANDTARVNKYLIDKYAINQVVDEALTSTTQIADQPFTHEGNQSIGVNFHYNTAGVATGTIHGIAFDNINLTGSTPPGGPFNLTANALQATLTLNMPWVSPIDNTVRTQTVGATGSDAATLNAVGSQMFYIGGNNHTMAEMIFSGLAAETDVFVQIIGGDSNWNGDLRVLANGTPMDWTTVANSSSSTASLMGFFATTDPQGRLDLEFSIFAGNYAGISGIIITQDVPEPLSALLVLLGLPALARRTRRRMVR